MANVIVNPPYFHRWAPLLKQKSSITGYHLSTKDNFYFSFPCAVKKLKFVVSGYRLQHTNGSCHFPLVQFLIYTYNSIYKNLYADGTIYVRTCYCFKQKTKNGSPGNFLQYVYFWLTPSHPPNVGRLNQPSMERRGGRDLVKRKANVVIKRTVAAV
jgi:hypothetical protein